MSTITQVAATATGNPKPPVPPNALEAIRDELSAIVKSNSLLVSNLTNTCIVSAGSWPAETQPEAPPVSDGTIGEIWGLIHSLSNQHRLAWNCADRLQMLFGKQG